MGSRGHGAGLYGGNRGREGDFSGGLAGAARGSGWGARAWAESQGVDLVWGFLWTLGVF